MTISSSPAVSDILDLLQHLAWERISSQHPAFGVLSEELQAQLSESEYRALLEAPGGRWFAQSFEIAGLRIAG